MSENITEEINENIEPPEVKLTTPDLPETSNTPKIETIWLVVAKNRRVNRDWEALITKLLRPPLLLRRQEKDHIPMILALPRLCICTLQHHLIHTILTVWKLSLLKRIAQTLQVEF